MPYHLIIPYITIILVRFQLFDYILVWNKIIAKSQAKSELKQRGGYKYKPLDHFDHILPQFNTFIPPISTTAQFINYTYIYYNKPSLHYVLSNFPPTFRSNI